MSGIRTVKRTTVNDRNAVARLIVRVPDAPLRGARRAFVAFVAFVSKDRPPCFFVCLYVRDANAALTRSGVNGTWRKRTPVASNTAFAIAAGTTVIAVSPAPIASPSA